MNKYVMAFLFLFSTGFFIYQHSTGFAWDFSVYYMNGQHLLTGQGYFEWYRPPLPSFLMILGEYFYIILVSLIGLLASIKFAKTYKLRPEVFYSLLLSPFVLAMGFKVGSEFLSLSLTLLFFSYIKDELAGFFFGLISLTHYTNLSTGFFLFFSGNWKKFLGAVLLGLLVFLPWFLYNQAYAGFPLYSVIDSYALNVGQRSYFRTLPDPTHFLLVGSFLIPLLFLGLRNFKKDRLIDWLMLAFLVIKVGNYFFIPFKYVRMLFMLALPLAFFSTRALEKYNYKAAIPVFATTFVLLAFALPYSLQEPASIYLDTINAVNGSCMTMSSAWVPLNYYGLSSEPAPKQALVAQRLADGYTLVLFKGASEPDYVRNDSFTHSFPVVYETPEVIVLSSDACVPAYDYVLDYIKETNATLMELYNESYSVWDVIGFS